MVKNGFYTSVQYSGCHPSEDSFNLNDDQILKTFFLWSICHAVHNALFLLVSAFIDIVHYYLYCSQTLPNPFQQVLCLIEIISCTLFFNFLLKMVFSRDVNHKDSTDAIFILVLLDTDFFQFFRENTALFTTWFMKVTFNVCISARAMQQMNVYVLSFVLFSHNISF